MSKAVQIAIFLVLIVSFCGCGLRKEDILLHSWKYAEGYHIGDWLLFDGGDYRIDEQLYIYKKGTKVAVVLEVDSKNMITKSFDTESMIIESIDTKKQGYYVAK